jgi:hypothetical protein
MGTGKIAQYFRMCSILFLICAFFYKLHLTITVLFKGFFNGHFKLFKEILSLTLPLTAVLGSVILLCVEKLAIDDDRSV